MNLTYSGQVTSNSLRSWDIPETFTEPGIVDNVPPTNSGIALVGGNSVSSTISFSTPLLNPVMAIQSLGNRGNMAYYNFTTPFTILNSGPGQWGGSASDMWQIGNNLYGTEGNGLIQFSGIYSSISWTIPDGESYHGFTVGATSAVPIPPSVLLFLSGIIGMVAVKKKLR